VHVNVNYRYLEDELAYLLENADAEVLVFHGALAEHVDAVRNRLPELQVVVQVDDGSPNLDGAVPFEEFLAAHEPARRVARSGDDLWFLYTGGTTGMPKGVMWRHEDIFFGAFGGGGLGNPITQPEDIAVRAQQGTTRCLPACPFMHGTAHWMAFLTLYTGGTVIISPDRSLDPVRVWELVAAEHVNFLVIVGDAMEKA